MKLSISRPAARDLDAIWSYIARDNLNAADKVISRIEQTIGTLVMFPGVGHARADLVDPKHLAYSVYSYLIIYRVSRDTLTVLNVIDGRRDLKRALK